MSALSQLDTCAKVCWSVVYTPHELNRMILTGHNVYDAFNETQTGYIPLPTEYPA